jgi:hypothetical protein
MKILPRVLQQMIIRVAPAVNPKRASSVKQHKRHNIIAQKKPLAHAVAGRFPADWPRHRRRRRRPRRAFREVAGVRSLSVRSVSMGAITAQFHRNVKLSPQNIDGWAIFLLASATNKTFLTRTAVDGRQRLGFSAIYSTASGRFAFLKRGGPPGRLHPRTPLTSSVEST